MSYYHVVLRGDGINCPFEGSATAMIGFFTTRRVRAGGLSEAQRLARESVDAEWRPGGRYAAINRGDVPALSVEDAYPVGLFTVLLGRRPSGYSFFSSNDDSEPEVPELDAVGDDILGKLDKAIRAHGLRTVRDSAQISIEEGRVVLEARVIDRDAAASQATVVLEICVHSPELGERPIVECFAGWGATRDLAVAAAFGKMLLGFLHVVMEGLTSHACEDGQSDIEHWAGVDAAWTICSGALVGQHSGESTLTGTYPSFMTQLTSLFERSVGPGPHWVRVFLAAYDGKVQAGEVLLDNEVWQEGLDLLLAQPWQATDEYQSTRHFFLALPEGK